MVGVINNEQLVAPQTADKSLIGGTSSYLGVIKVWNGGRHKYTGWNLWFGQGQISKQGSGQIRGRIRYKGRWGWLGPLPPSGPGGEGEHPLSATLYTLFVSEPGKGPP